MNDLVAWRTSVREAAKDAIPAALVDGPLKMADLYEMMVYVAPELCDDGIPCKHNGKKYAASEWRHQVRWALQDLKAQNAGKRRDGEWSLT